MAARADEIGSAQLASSRPALRVVHGGAGSGEERRRPQTPPRVARVRPIRRIIAPLLTLGGLLGLWFGSGALAARPQRVVAFPGAVRTASGLRYVARSGDTLWSIASAAEPGADPRPLIDELSAQLHGEALQPGDVLELP